MLGQVFCLDQPSSISQLLIQRKGTIMKKFTALLLVLALVLSLAACSSNGNASSGSSSGQESSLAESSDSSAESSASSQEGKTFKIGLCNYVDDASLNQIVDNITAQLETLGEEEGVTFEIESENCNADSNVLNQIIQNFISDDVDLMIGVATPVAMAMQAATEDNQIPVVFAAVSDPVGAGLVENADQPEANITGTSDFLNTNAIMDLIFAQDPDADNIALLYDLGQDSSTTSIATAKAYLDDKGVSYTEYTGTSVDEIGLAVQNIIADGADAVFTPSDNTVMTAELSIYEDLANAGIPHYAGADSFALNGAFCGYGVDYINLGVETANMVNDILVNGQSVADTPVMTFDNGIATVNTDVCTSLGLDYDTVAETFAPYCTSVNPITTAEEFDQ